jgi:hypothetical protein
MSREDNIVEALLDKFLRAKDAPRMLSSAFLDRIIIVGEDQTC